MYSYIYAILKRIQVRQIEIDESLALSPNYVAYIHTQSKSLFSAVSQECSRYIEARRTSCIWYMIKRAFANSFYTRHFENSFGYSSDAHDLKKNAYWSYPTQTGSPVSFQWHPLSTIRQISVSSTNASDVSLLELDPTNHSARRGHKDAWIGLPAYAKSKGRQRTSIKSRLGHPRT